MADPSIDWVPVAQLLEAASNELEVGQMLHTSVFSLFEAMSAVEIGNQKMDPGARPHGDTTPLEQRELLLQLSPVQLLGVMDRLMSLEATWHNGGSLARTVYSSLYMMQQERTAAGNAVLAAFCSGLEATCAEVNHLIMQGCVCEEEDFNAHVVGLPLEHKLTAAGQPATGTPQQQQPAAASGSSSSSKKGKKQSAEAAAAAAAYDAVISGLDKASGSSSSSSDEAAAAAAIAARLQFRKLLLQGLVRLKQRGFADLNAASKLLSKALEKLTVITQTLELGQGEPALGVDENLNSHRVPAVPPRAVQLYSSSQAVQHFEGLLQQLVKVCSVTQVDSYRTLKDFILEFTAAPVGPISRSALHIQVSYNAWVPLPPSPDNDAAGAAAAASSSSTGNGAAAAAATAAAAGSSGLNVVDSEHPHQHPHTAPVLVHCSSASSAAGHACAEAAAAAAAEQQQQQQQQEQGLDALATAAAAASAAAASADVVLPLWCLSPAMLKETLLITGDGTGDESEMFLEQALIATSNLVQALLMNRSRCRRRLRRGLDDWGNLYQHALNADSSPQFRAYRTLHGWDWQNEQPDDLAGPQATWVEAETAWAMIRHLLMGFELQLYEPADYSMIYWYIDFLGMVMQQNLKLLQDFKPTIVKPHGSRKGSSSSSSSGSKAANGMAGGKLPTKSSKGIGGSSGSSKALQPAAAAAAAQPPPPPPSFMITNLVLESWKHLSVGILRVMMSLQMLRMYQPPELLFNSEAQRYDQRFASFHLLQRPDPLSYDQYLHSTNTSGVSPEQLLRLAFDSFRKAQQACVLLRTQAAAWQVGKAVLQESAQLERVAATNSVATSLLSRAAAPITTTASSSSSSSKGGSTGGSAGRGSAPMFKPFFEFAHHKWFPTLTLKSAAAAAKPAAAAITAAAAGGGGGGSASSDGSTGSAGQ